MAKIKGDETPTKVKKGSAKPPKPGDTDPCASLACGAIAAMLLQNLLITALIMSLIVGMMFLMFSGLEKVTGDSRTQALAETLAGRLADRIELYRQQLAEQTQQLDLATALTNGDGPTLRSHEETLSRWLPASPKIHIFDANVERLEREAGVGVSYALLDMLRAAAQGAQVPAEIHVVDGNYREVVLVHPIRAATGGVAGIVHAAFPASFLEPIFRSLNIGGGLLTLRQTSGDKVWTLHETAAGDNPTTSVRVPGSIWEVGYTYRVSDDLGGILTYVIMLLAVGVALIFMVSLANLKRIRNRLRDDLADFRSALNELLGKGVTHARSTRMKELQLLMDWLVHSAYVLPGEPRTEPATSKKTLARLSTRPKSPPKAASVPGYDVVEEDSDPPPSTNEEPSHPAPASASPIKLPAGIFHSYDIRGHTGEELTREVVFELGRAIGSESLQKHQNVVIVGRDTSRSGGELIEALTRGILGTGCNLVDIGTITTPQLYFATHYLGSNSGVMLSGSDTDPDHACIKVVINGKSLSGGALTKLRQRIESGDLMEGEGIITTQELVADYLERIHDDVHLTRPLHLVVDAGNGAAGSVAPQLLRGLGCEVTELYCEPDSGFPNHPPDPSQPENLRDLIAKVQETGADLGLAFDGDGDRLGVVDSAGKIIWPDRLLILLAKDVLSRQPGADIIYDVKSTRHLAPAILNAGGRPIMWKTGHSLIKEMMKQTDALLAGEFSGHIFFKERWYGFDDALYASARLVEVLAMDTRSSAEIFADIPEDLTTPELHAHTPVGVNEKLMQLFSKRVKMPDAKLVTVDGVRAEFDDGWGLVRSSNTTSCLSFRFEASDEKAMKRIQEIFRQQITTIAPDVKLPF